MKSFEVSMSVSLSACVFLPVCFQAAGAHVERCITGFNVPCSQH